MNIGAYVAIFIGVWVAIYVGRKKGMIRKRTF